MLRIYSASQTSIKCVILYSNISDFKNSFPAVCTTGDPLKFDLWFIICLLLLHRTRKYRILYTLVCYIQETRLLLLLLWKKNIFDNIAVNLFLSCVSIVCWCCCSGTSIIYALTNMPIVIRILYIIIGMYTQ